MGILRARVGGAWVDVGGTDEVAVVPDDPIVDNPHAQLWYDTDGTIPLSNDYRWNTAWGVVATGVLKPSPVSLTALTAVPVTDVLNVATVTGRRYRVMFEARAIQPTGANALYRIDLRIGGVSILPGGTPLGLGITGWYNVIAYHWLLGGDGTTKALDVTISSDSVVSTLYTEPAIAYFYVEDIGPVTGSTAAPLANDQRWGTAWGVVAVGTMKPFSATPVTANVETTITENILYQTLVGRRYRLCCRCRAATSSSAQYAYVRFYGSGITTNDTYSSLTSVYNNLDAQTVFNGTGVVGTYYAAALNPVAWTLWTDQAAVSHFYLEDLGPINPYAPVVDPTPAWIAPTFTNSWVNYGSVYQVAGYRKIGDIVYVRGFIKSGTMGQAAFTLPAGYRPPADLYLASTGYAGGASSVLGVIIAQSSGAFIISEGGNNNFSINISFSVTA